MSMSTLYRHAAVLAPRHPATPHEARMLSRLATRAQELAKEDGDVLSRRDALARARENLAYVHQLSLVREMEMARNLGVGGVKESEWKP